VTPSRFVVQLQDATRLHYDMRVRRLAVPVEDHELSAGDFEGVHEGSRRGTGAVIIWDEGRAEVRRDDPGHMSVALYGQKLGGGFGLTRTGEQRWVLVKVGDEFALPGSDITADRPESVRTGGRWEELVRR
jgi:bifunctional non-homologous end joining protein LigD